MKTIRAHFGHFLNINQIHINKDEFKQNDSRKDIEFPDPKYYMIGFTFCDVEKEQENTVDVLEDTQNENTEDYGVNSRILWYKSLEEENNDENWKNITSVINKTSLQPVDTNKE